VPSPRDLLELLCDRRVEPVERTWHAWLRGSAEDRAGERERSPAAEAEPVGDLGVPCAGFERELTDAVQLGERVVGGRVDRDNGLPAETANELDVPRQVRCTRVERAVAVVLQRLDARDEHDGGGLEPSQTAGDVDELLEAHVRAEAALGDD